MKQCFTVLSCHQCAARPVCCIKKIDFSSQFTRDTSQFPAPSTNLILTVIIRCIAELHQRFWQAKMPGFSRQTYCISTENVCEYIAQIQGHVKKARDLSEPTLVKDNLIRIHTLPEYFYISKIKCCTVTTSHSSSKICYRYRDMSILKVHFSAVICIAII